MGDEGRLDSLTHTLCSLTNYGPVVKETEERDAQKLGAKEYGPVLRRLERDAQKLGAKEVHFDERSSNSKNDEGEVFYVDDQENVFDFSDLQDFCHGSSLVNGCRRNGIFLVFSIKEILSCSLY